MRLPFLPLGELIQLPITITNVSRASKHAHNSLSDSQIQTMRSTCFVMSSASRIPQMVSRHMRNGVTFAS